ncbi:MAG: hypothetical protein OJJ21_12105 [Ferrovibrio sp.]|uniref:hypothetical protein n=1 Tax=Ferrovibrio sp. TaxID=1917215 RepID=UPI002634B23F|nr:hypothetical protein [Ferrovibrio sp.]MCW0234333.1 hypothetical protein [Ferrovibrio sp.]
MRDAVPLTRGIPRLPVSFRHRTDGGMAGELPLHILLADEAMEAVLRSAGHTATTFMQQWRGFAALPRDASPVVLPAAA